MTLTEFLLARIAEDEEAAGSRMTAIAPIRGGCRGIGCLRRADQPHAFGCPARVLRRCEADRRIVALYTGSSDDHNDGIPVASYGDVSMAEFAGEKRMHWAVLRALALPYADHPDYDEEWKP